MHACLVAHLDLDAKPAEPILHAADHGVLCRPRGVGIEIEHVVIGDAVVCRAARQRIPGALHQAARHDPCVRQCQRLELARNGLVGRIAQRECKKFVAGHGLISSWPGLSRPSTSSGKGKQDVDARHKAGHDEKGAAAQCTAVKNRATRKPESQVHTGWLRMPRSHEPTTASARPTRLSIGKRPTPPSRTETRLSAELSRLSPSTNSFPGGTVTSGVLSSRPLSRSLKIACDTPFGSVSM